MTCKESKGCRTRELRKGDAKMIEIALTKATGISLANDIIEIRPGDFKGGCLRRS
jgi:hypothetical protein